MIAETCGECGKPVVYCYDQKLGEAGPIDLTCEDGHVLHAPAETTARARITALRQIKREHSARRVDGFTVDVQTASALCAVYDALKPENKERFGKPPLDRLVDFAWKHVRRAP